MLSGTISPTAGRTPSLTSWLTPKLNNLFATKFLLSSINPALTSKIKEKTKDNDLFHVAWLQLFKMIQLTLIERFKDLKASIKACQYLSQYALKPLQPIIERTHMTSQRQLYYLASAIPWSTILAWVAKNLHQVVLRHPTLTFAPTVWITLLFFSLWPPKPLTQSPNNLTVPSSPPLTHDQRRRFSRLLKKLFQSATQQFSDPSQQVATFLPTLTLTERDTLLCYLARALSSAMTFTTSRLSRNAHSVFNITLTSSAIPVTLLRCRLPQAKRERETTIPSVRVLFGVLNVHVRRHATQSVALWQPPARSTRSACILPTCRRQQNTLPPLYGMSFDAASHGTFFKLLPACAKLSVPKQTRAPSFGTWRQAFLINPDLSDFEGPVTLPGN